MKPGFADLLVVVGGLLLLVSLYAVAPWLLGVVGGLAAIGAGLLLARREPQRKEPA